MPNDFPHPARTIRSYSDARRHAASTSSIVKSAVQSVSASGALLTAIPRARAAATSMWSYPALAFAMIFTLGGNAAMCSACSPDFLPISTAGVS